MDATGYKCLLGKLNFLTVTRPNISHIVRIISQFIQNPNNVIWMLFDEYYNILRVPEEKVCYIRVMDILRLKHIYRY